MEDKKRIGIIYLFWHKRFKEEATKRFKDKDDEFILTRKEVLSLLGVVYHIPRELRYNILKEMRDFSLLEIIGRDKIKIL